MLHGRKLRGDGVGRVRQRSLARILLLSVLLGGFSSADAQEAPRRVLILYPDSNVNRSALVVGEAIRKRLLERADTNIKTHGEFLDLSNFQTTGTGSASFGIWRRSTLTPHSMSWWRLVRQPQDGRQ
jgi:hypothetical protein